MASGRRAEHWGASAAAFERCEGPPGRGALRLRAARLRAYWRALAATARDAKLTLVIYMGVSSADHIQAELLSGLGAHTPVAIVQHATLPQQRHAVTTLGQLSATLRAEGLGSPAVMVVGDVVRGVAAVGVGHEAAQRAA